MSIQRALIPSGIDFLRLPDASVQDRPLLVGSLRFRYLRQFIDFVIKYRLAQFVNRILDLHSNLAFLRVSNVGSERRRAAENDQRGNNTCSQLQFSHKTSPIGAAL